MKPSRTFKVFFLNKIKVRDMPEFTQHLPSTNLIVLWDCKLVLGKCWVQFDRSKKKFKEDGFMKICRFS